MVIPEGERCLDKKEKEDGWVAQGKFEGSEEKDEEAPGAEGGSEGRGDFGLTIPPPQDEGWNNQGKEADQADFSDELEPIIVGKFFSGKDASIRISVLWASNQIKSIEVAPKAPTEDGSL